MAVYTPIQNEKKKTKTNVEIVKEVYSILDDLKNGKGATSDSEKIEMQKELIKMCGTAQNADEIYEWCKQIAEEPDYDRAQSLISRTLLPLA